jgi:hypothetical protein
MATTYDIHFQIVPEEEQEGANGRVFTFGYASAVGVKGPQKLVNRWVKCFFTLKGSDPLLRTYGTGFSELIGSNVSRPDDFTDAVALAINDCNQQITAFDQKNFPPDDERLSSAVLTSVVPRGADGYDVYVTIKNAAGALLTTLLPAGSTRP